MTAKKILSVGHMQFPLGQAQVQRQLLMAKAIIHEGFDVTVLCRYGIHREEDSISNEGFFEGVHYVYCSGSSIRPDGFFRRNLSKLKGVFNEYRYYREFSKNGQLAGALVSTNWFHNILFYFLLGKIFGIITVVDNVEYWTANKSIKGFQRFDKYLYDKFYFHFADKIICISDFLISKVNISRKGKILKIPSITDFDKFRQTHTDPIVKTKYFLFCGSKAYSEIIDFVISSFEVLNQRDFSLVLITANTRSLIERIDKCQLMDRIMVMTDIPYADLVNLYVNSEALIIPMRDNDQDKARFPHKIGEYCAAGRPIITNKVGEILNYFNESNSYLCSDYNITEYAEAMARIISDPLHANDVAKHSHQTGLLHFNYRSYSKPIVNLFDQA
jgi:glycosyltransferase involved in cell wall biosynthesis